MSVESTNVLLRVWSVLILIDVLRTALSDDRGALATGLYWVLSAVAAGGVLIVWRGTRLDRLVKGGKGGLSRRDRRKLLNVS